MNKIKVVVSAVAVFTVFSSHAQTESNAFSLNIVGYAKVRIGGGNDIFANPFDLDGTNSADKILNHAALSDTGGNPGLDSFYVLTWNGHGFDSCYFEQDFTPPNTGGAVTNGWATDPSGSAQAVPPNLPPGKGFFINNGGPIVTNVFVGAVVPSPGSSACMTIVGGNQLIASILPVNGQIQGPTNIAEPPLPPIYFPIAALSDAGGNQGLDSFYINTWNGAGFDSVYYEQDFTSSNTGGAVTNGWATDPSGSGQAVPPTVRIGHGFFLNNSGPVTPWCQSLTNNP